MKSKGFTVIEMLIAMAIIGALAMMIMPYFIKAKFKADYTACISNERSIAEALEIRKNQTGAYPKDLQELLSSTALGKVPSCPSNGGSYLKTYQVSEKLDLFTIYCPGIHHKLLDVHEGYPQYSSQTGVMEKYTK